MTNNRELKFRAWTGAIMIYSGQDANYSLKFRGINSYKHDLKYEFFDPELSLMQFTGLKDKNGKEIYEEDIIKQNRQNCKVEWNESQAMFGFYEKTSMGKTWRSNCYDSLTDSEVVGNIHENPELLEVLNDKQ